MTSLHTGRKRKGNFDDLQGGQKIYKKAEEPPDSNFDENRKRTQM
jgi:hypothetical protein